MFGFEKKELQTKRTETMGGGGGIIIKPPP